VQHDGDKEKPVNRAPGQENEGSREEHRAVKKKGEEDEGEVRSAADVAGHGFDLEAGVRCHDRNDPPSPG